MRSKWMMTLFVASCLCGCQSIKISMLEKLGYEKRDILVDRVKTAQDAQKAAQTQFKDALEQFGSVVRYEGGQLETEYKKLERVLQRSEARAQDVRERIHSVDAVAQALFKEWRQELNQYASESLRVRSEEKLRQTRMRYDDMMAAMRQAESALEPVLRPLRDQVLYLKHNLNAQALAFIKDELAGVQADVDALLKEMNRAIAEADLFIQAMRKT